MDPVTIFNALYDTKCLKFGQFELKSGLVAPYYVNLRRVPLYPKLMDSIVGLAVERFLTRQDLEPTIESSPQLVKPNSIDNKLADLGSTDSDVDSQLDDETDLEESDSASEHAKVERLSHHLDPVVCGVPYGAIPLATAIACKAGLPLLFERKEDKAYGDLDCFMDDFTNETRAASNERVPAKDQMSQTKQRVILVEDVICSGQSILNTVRRLENRNMCVEFVICIVDREENGINLLLKQAGIKVMPLFNISAILRILEVSGRITTEQFIRTHQWMSQNQRSNVLIEHANKPMTLHHEPVLAKDDLIRNTIHVTAT